MAHTVIARHQYLDKIEPYLDSPVVKVLTGMRRIGKSTILQQLRDQLLRQGVAEGNIILLDLERVEFDHLRDYRALHAEVTQRLAGTTGRRTILLDEIQEVSEWERAVQSFLAEGLGDIVITGSNAHMLSSELATYLTGRYIEIPVFPLSLPEFSELRAAGAPGGDPRRHFADYVQYGGLPGIHTLPFEPDIVQPFIKSVADAIVLHDVVKRNSVRDVALLERLTHFVLSNTGNVTSAKRISEYLKSQQLRVGNETVANYLQYLCDARMLYKVKRYDIQGKRHLEYLDKYYPGDTGLLFAHFGTRPQSIAGALETVVFLELCRRGYAVTVGALTGREIDFVAERRDERLYLQVAASVAEPATREREFGNLHALPDNYPKMVLSLDELAGGSERGVRWMRIPDWLVGDDAGRA